MKGPDFKPRYRKAAVPFATLTLAGSLLVGGYSRGAAKPAEQRKTIVDNRPFISMKGNMVGFLLNSTTCLNGGARPCALLIRETPHLASSYVNAIKTEKIVKWPKEPYKRFAGHSINVACYITNGDVDGVTDSIGLPPSTDWYEIAVPDNRVVDTDPAEPYVYMSHDGQSYTIGFGALAWFDQSSPAPNVSACTGQELTVAEGM